MGDVHLISTGPTRRDCKVNGLILTEADNSYLASVRELTAVGSLMPSCVGRGRETFRTEAASVRTLPRVGPSVTSQLVTCRVRAFARIAFEDVHHFSDQVSVFQLRPIGNRTTFNRLTKSDASKREAGETKHRVKRAANTGKFFRWGSVTLSFPACEKIKWSVRVLMLLKNVFRFLKVRKKANQRIFHFANFRVFSERLLQLTKSTKHIISA